MKMYEEFAKYLAQLLGGSNAVRITVPGYLSLSVEDIGMSKDGTRLVSLCHYGEQDGDLMRDPDMVFLLYDLPDSAAAEPISFRNDYLGMEACESHGAGSRTHAFPHRKLDLADLAQTWFVTLHEQGFFEPTAQRDILT